MTFAREGAKVFLTGRTKAKVDLVAGKINAAGGYAEAAEVNALDEQAVEQHINMVIGKAGNIDISFNAIGLRNTTLNSALTGNACLRCRKWQKSPRSWLATMQAL